MEPNVQAVVQSTGQQLAFGEIVRADGSGSEFVLNDGSRVEMRSKSELLLEPAADGVRVQLNQGSVIITAAEQRRGHLYVRTKDLVVSVVGTVFIVQAEEAGSRVSVIQGEVRVQQGEQYKKLLAGEQVATNPLMEPQSVSKEVSWSSSAETHLAVLQQVAPAAAPPKKLEFEVASIRQGATGRSNVSSRLRCLGADGTLDVIDGAYATLIDVYGDNAPAVPRGRCVGGATVGRSIQAQAVSQNSGAKLVRRDGGLHGYSAGLRDTHRSTVAKDRVQELKTRMG